MCLILENVFICRAFTHTAKSPAVVHMDHGYVCFEAVNYEIHDQ